jgi:hypothetical protein
MVELRSVPNCPNLAAAELRRGFSTTAELKGLARSAGQHGVLSSVSKIRCSQAATNARTRCIQTFY